MKTGRPKVYPEHQKIIESMYSEGVTSRMGKNNKIYELIALKIIKSKAPDIETQFSFKGMHPKSSLLAEIGRWQDEKIILKLAKEYVESKMTVQSFIEHSRALRLNKSNQVIAMRSLEEQNETEFKRKGRKKTPNISLKKESVYGLIETFCYSLNDEQWRIEKREIVKYLSKLTNERTALNE
jgi:hypothetical protein